MVGLFKKLSKKKPRNSKKNASVSGDESCTEDEGSEKILQNNQYHSPTSAHTKSGNGICSVTPVQDGRSLVSDACSPVSSIARNSDLVNFEGIGDDLKDAFDIGNDNEDDALSINSTEEGSLFDEDILSQFQDGQISFQQFLQSPHLSRSEERIRDDEIDSFFSDSRSIESSNYYSDSSSGSNRTEQRDEELDRIAGELFGNYGEKFSDDRFAIQKTRDNAEQADNRSVDESSTGDQTLANSFSTLTITAENNDATDFTCVNSDFNAEESNNDSFSFMHLNKGNEALQTRNPRPINDLFSEKLVSSQVSKPTNSADQTEICSSASMPLGINSQIPSKEFALPATDSLRSNSLKRIQGDQPKEVQKTLLDLVHERGRTALCESAKGSNSTSSSCVCSPTPQGIVSPLQGTSASNSRPSSAQSLLSQREVAIIDNTVVSLDGQYTLPSSTEARNVQSKIDPWLSYLPHWKLNAPRESPLYGHTSGETFIGDLECSKVISPIDMLRPESALPTMNAASPSNASDRYIRFSSLDLDFFIPPPPAEDDVPSTAQKVDADVGGPSHLEWDYEIAGSPTITPSSSLIYIGNGESKIDNTDPIAESLLSLLPIDLEKFESSVSNALGEIITEIVSSRQKILNLTRVLEFQDAQIKQQRKLIDSQARELFQISCNSRGNESLRLQRSPQFSRRSEFRSYPATGRRSKELVDLEYTLDKLLYQCHSLQKSSSPRPDIQVLQPISREGTSISREGTLSRAESSHSDDSVVEVKALLCKKIPESPANHVQIVPAKGVVYNSCKEMKDDMSAIQR